MPGPSDLLLHPVRRLGAAAARPRLPGAVLLVAVSGLAGAALEYLADALAPRSLGNPSLLLLVLLPALVAFWGLCGWLIDIGARLMARPPRRRPMLAAAAQCFVLLAGYGLVELLQALALRAGAGSVGAGAVGWLDAPLFLWFVALLAVAVVRVYDVEPLAALALTLLPFAALLTALLLYAAAAAGIGALLGGGH
jgi:hypothetical protein